MDSINHNTARSNLNSSLNARVQDNKHQVHTAPSAPQRTSEHTRAVQLADDLAAVLAQFRRRLDTEKRSPNSGDPFDRILEEDAEPKIEHLLFIAQAQETSPQELLLQARAMFPDDSDLIIVLREIIKRRKLSNASTDVLEEVMQEVWAQADQKQTQAGINVGIKAQVFAKKMAVTPWSLRDTYRQFLVSGDGEVSQYEHWVEQYGGDSRHTVLEFIETALLHDIQAHDPSCSKLEFGPLLGHVVNFRRLRGSDEEFMKEFADSGNGKEKNQEQKEDDDPNAKQEEKTLAEALACWFDCLQRPFKIQREVSKNNLTGLMKRFNLPREALQQKLLRAIKHLDGDLFFDAEAKQVLIESLLNVDVRAA